MCSLLSLLSLHTLQVAFSLKTSAQLCPSLRQELLLPCGSLLSKFWYWASNFIPLLNRASNFPDTQIKVDGPLTVTFIGPCPNGPIIKGLCRPVKFYLCMFPGLKQIFKDCFIYGGFSHTHYVPQASRWGP